MKTWLVLALGLVSMNALAKDLRCSGDIDFRGEEGKVEITMNDRDGLVVANHSADGMSSSSVSLEAKKVQRWKEGVVPVIGYAPGIKIYLLRDGHATLRRLEGWGTGNPNGDFADLHCE